MRFDDHKGLLAEAEDLAAAGRFDEFDRLVLELGDGASDALKVLYASCLRDQGRLRDALGFLLGLAGDEAEVMRRDVMVQMHRLRQMQVVRQTGASRSENPGGHTALDKVIEELIEGASQRRLQEGRGVTFFTSQLGPGGSERQLTRIAGALRASAYPDPVRVVVRGLKGRERDDFFLPVLTEAGIETQVLADVARAKITDPDVVQPSLRPYLHALGKSQADAILRLIGHLRETRPEVIYIWQDGAVLVAALAALFAGVPRIVTSFRGLPPNLRPDRMNPEMPALFRSLAQNPRVTFSANSAIAARAYESWLSLRDGVIEVIPNAVQSLDDTPLDEDAAFWREVEERSPLCRRTVLGIFRFDANKRPGLWVRSAAAHAARDPHTRFVLLGGGPDFEATGRLVRDLGMQDRIFLAGVRKSVGFFLSHADLLMHLAKTEGLPNVIIEAQMAGVPVLATPAGGTVEILRDGETGRLLQSAATPDPQEIQSMLTGLLADPDGLAQMAARAQAFAGPRFALPNVLEQTLGLLIRKEAPRS